MREKRRPLPAGYSERANGLIMARFTVEGKRYTVYGQTVKECREKELQRREQVREGRYKPGRELTVKEYCERWLENKAGTVKETTIRTDRLLIARICRTRTPAGLFGNMKLTKVEPQNVKDLQRALQKPMKAEGPDGKEKTYKAMTTRGTNDCIYLLKAIYKTALEEHIIEWSPVTVKPLKRTEQPARDTIHRALTKQETADFLKAATGSWYYNLYIFLLNTGCRIGEAGALTVSDVNNKTARICKTITRTEEGGHKIGDETKTAAGQRTIPLNTEARKAWNSQRETNALYFQTGIIDLKSPVFVPQKGGLLKASTVNADIARICSKAGIEKFSAHAFRDTFATRCVENGMQIKTLQEILGHTDISMTLGLYTHVMPETKAEQLQAVSFL